MTQSLPLWPAVPIESKPIEGRIRLGARWMRFALRSVKSRDWDFVGNAVNSMLKLIALSCADAARRSSDAVECNICHWTGRCFYPNTGPGYNDHETTCPGCRCIDRHRSLLAMLASRTTFFDTGTSIIEVAPMRGFEALCRAQPGIAYTSFDIERRAMVKGDITDMDVDSETADYFVCFHVLEHIPDADKALAEIRRVLRPGGTAVLQVPIDWTTNETVEYGEPDPRDVGHVRQYGSNFSEVISAAGFDVVRVQVDEVYDRTTIARFGLSREPIFLARRA